MSLKAQLADSSKPVRTDNSLGGMIRAKYVLPLIKSDGLVLDVGPGVAPKGDVNVDLNKESGLRGNCANFVLADATHLPFKDGCFDIVVSSDLLEHIADDESALAEMWRVGNKLVLHTPNKNQTHIVHVKGTIILRADDGAEQVIPWGEEQADHERKGYTSEELAAKLIKVGFGQVKVTPTFNVLECLAWELDRFIIFQVLSQKGPEALKNEIYPVRRDHMYKLIYKLAGSNPAEYVNLGWLVEAKKELCMETV